MMNWLSFFLFRRVIRNSLNPMSSNALDYVSIKGFKSISSLEKLELRPINILIGPNGSGKSNFIGAFSFLHAIREGDLQQYVTSAGGSEKLLHFGSKTTSRKRNRLPSTIHNSPCGRRFASATANRPT